MEYGKLTVTDAVVHPELGEIYRVTTRKIRNAPLKPWFVVVHYTVGTDFNAMVRLLSEDPNRKASVQFVVGMDGELAQIGNLRQAMWHAGTSSWVHGGKRYSGLNAYSIGIEVCCQGWLNEKGERGQWRQKAGGYTSRWYKKNEVNVGRHPNPKVAAWLGNCGWHRFTDAQMDTLEALLDALTAAYPIKEIIGHDDCSPERKQDPGHCVDDREGWFDKVNGRMPDQIVKPEPKPVPDEPEPGQPLRVSEACAQMVAEFEGFVSRAYYDSGGTLTIGHGLTNHSPTARKHLGQIRPGMTITKGKSLMIKREALEIDYAPYVDKWVVAKASHQVKQREYDAMVSLCYNAGPGTLKDKWAKAFIAGNVRKAAGLITTTRVRDRAGNYLLGLKRRRQAEARLMVEGVYFSWAHPTYGPLDKASAGKGDAILREYQGKLKQLGFDPGAIDGLRGPNTTKAVKAFQEAHGLKVDGVLGRGTMTTIDRVLTQTADKKVTTPAAGIGLLGLLLPFLADWPDWAQWVFAASAAAGIAALLFVGWTYRGWLTSTVKGALAEDAATIKGWFA